MPAPQLHRLLVPKGPDADLTRSHHQRSIRHEMKEQLTPGLNHTRDVVYALKYDTPTGETKYMYYQPGSPPLETPLAVMVGEKGGNVRLTRSTRVMYGATWHDFPRRHSLFRLKFCPGD